MINLHESMGPGRDLTQEFDLGPAPYIDFISAFCCPLIIFANSLDPDHAFFQDSYQIVKGIGTRSGPTFCQSWSGSKLFAKVIRSTKVTAA